MSLDDIEYYRRRAREERERAEKTDIPEAAQAHRDLASHYEALVEHADMLPPTRRAGDPPEQEEQL
jgi:hypothetical protein